jgi:hypothetical protein
MTAAEISAWAERKMNSRDTPPKYNPKLVEQVILEEAVRAHRTNPQRLTIDELAMRIVSDPDDNREIETAAQAIRSLQEFGVFKDRDDEIVEPTPATLQVVALLG